MTFPLKPFLDRVIVEVTPIEQFFEQPKGAFVDLNDARSQYRSDRGTVKAVGDGVPMAGVFVEMPVAVGDEVRFDPDNGYAGQIFLNPADKMKVDMPIYLELRVGDLLGRGLRSVSA
jgi:co-chaperonin GroES (HSP10)